MLRRWRFPQRHLLAAAYAFRIGTEFHRIVSRAIHSVLRFCFRTLVIELT